MRQRGRADQAGTTAHLLRIWPHTVITLVANELIMTQYRSVRDKW